MEQKLCLLPVNGNSYHTPYGLYECQVIKMDYPGYGTDVTKLEVRLRNNGDSFQPVRLLTIIGKQKRIEQRRLSLVFDVHRWALLDKRDGEYWAKKVMV